ncbi:unnamed protein product [Prunus armeniaca]
MPPKQHVLAGLGKRKVTRAAILARLRRYLINLIRVPPSHGPGVPVSWCPSTSLVKIGGRSKENESLEFLSKTDAILDVFLRNPAVPRAGTGWERKGERRRFNSVQSDWSEWRVAVAVVMEERR